ASDDERNVSTKLPRRGFLKAAGTTALALSARKSFAASSQPLPIAAVVTCYTENSHADVIVGKILEGYEQNGGPGPNLRVASVYVDQTPRRELSRKLAEKHGFRLAETIDEALTLGT